MTSSDRSHESHDDSLRKRIAELEQRVAEQQRTIDGFYKSNSGNADDSVMRQAVIRCIDCTSDFIGIADMEGNAFYVNDAGQKMVGLENLEAARRTHVSNHFDPADLPEVMQKILPEVMQTGRWEGEYRFRHMVTGAIIPVHYNLFLVKDEANKAIGLATITRDLRSIKGVEEERRQLQEEMIRVQAAALAELSTPLIPISDRVVVMPLIGTVDEVRANKVLETLLNGVTERGADIAILDITGVSVVDTAVANAIVHAAQAVGLLGARVVLTGIRPEVARTLIDLGIGLEGLTVRATLQSGIAFAMGRR